MTFNKTRILCVIWSKMEFLLSQMCCHIPYPALRLSWQPDWWQISVVVLRKIVFPQLLPIFYWSAIILWRYYRFPHHLRLRQFTSFNPLLIPWNQVTLPSLLSLLPIPYPFCYPVKRLSVWGKGDKNPVIFSDHTFSKQKAFLQATLFSPATQAKQILAFRAHQ